MGEGENEGGSQGGSAGGGKTGREEERTGELEGGSETGIVGRSDGGSERERSGGREGGSEVGGGEGWGVNPQYHQVMRLEPQSRWWVQKRAWGVGEALGALPSPTKISSHASDAQSLHNNICRFSASPKTRGGPKGGDERK